MPDQPHDFLKDYQAFAQQSWDTWMRYLQQQPGNPSPFGGMPPTASQDDFLTRSLANLQAYGTWLQQAAGAGAGVNPMMGNWQQPTVMQPFLAAFNQPFAQTVAGIDSASAFGLDHQWNSWLQAMQRAGMSGLTGAPSQTATFGIAREMQLDQQALAAAMAEYAQINARYQALLQKVNTDGISRLQDMLAARAEPGQQIQSLKALYDLWVDAMEEAYSQMALSDEYREVFGELVNAQMRVRQMQQQQTEQMCRELGIPTRSEVDSLGKRVQQLRREMRERQRPVPQQDETLVDALQTEIADLKRELAAAKAKTKDASAVRPIKSAASTAKAPRSASSKRK
ncbi:pha synthase subunit protein [Dyella dinghuensis]|uniref:Poly(3-hydroxyalkanoate) polymerase subunit PhaE n=1 Tax=Dyella dinghuensis TaxID=1920169 RepID=A0A3S0WQP5_9GAMM|nr:poly(R)-hydroxyalkanoic acid synthase subunit PhaE [Dyella dinghuensis]RUL66168.1 pha synthase subunit protein [Dyella dinghuensis]